MNWVLGIVGAIAGVVLGQSSWLLGAVLGFFVMYLFMSLLELRRNLTSLEQELARLRLQREAAPAPAQRVPPAAAPASPSVAPAPAPTSPAPSAPVSAGQSEPPPIPVNYTTRPAAVAGETLPPGLDEAAIAAARARIVARSAAAMTNGNGNGANTNAGAAAPPPRAYAPRPPREPDFGEKLVGTLKSWFTEGNVPVKIGVLVLFAGVAAALKYAAAQGYFTFPIEYRLVAIAVAALAALAFGFRERERKPAFGLSLQGGAIGVLLLTVFASYKLYGLLPPTLAFALVVGLVAGAAALSVLQKNMPLAVLGFLGGYLAPVLINTGSNNYIGLFSYYAVLNAAVFAISWKQSWRLLNIMGFLFTFGVGTAWGAANYRPEMFPTVEPFLILFFVFYVVIGLLYVVRQTQYRRPFVDGTLVFGTPLVAFPLQAKLLEDNRLGLAFSALAVAVVYAGLMWFLRRRNERLLTEAYGALALGFATLAIPLAFSAGTTATLWALEGVGVAWLGLRQNRTFPWLSGLALQLLAAGSYVAGWDTADALMAQPGTSLFLNAMWFGAAILALSGFALSLIHDRHRPMPALSILLFGWGTAWWFFAIATQTDLAEVGIGNWTYVMSSLAATIVIATGLRVALDWLRMHWLVALSSLFGMVMVFVAYDEFDAPLAGGALPMWTLYFAALFAALWAGRDIPSRSLSLAHLAFLWTLAMLATFQAGEYVDDQDLAEGWRFVGICLPVMLMTFGLWRVPQVFAQPRDAAFAGYRLGWLAPANLLLILAFAVGLFFPGESAPLPYLPLVNPLELGLLAILALLVAQMRDAGGQFTALFRLWPVLGFAFITMATLRAVHHWHGEPWSGAILDSGYTQTCLTLVWSLLGVGSMLIGSRRFNRPLWVGGMVLMILICAKLALIDRLYMGNTTGIVSCLGVGILLVGVGYFAPSPPKDDKGVTA